MRVRWREGVGRLAVTHSACVYARAVCVCVCGVLGSSSLPLSAEEHSSCACMWMSGVETCVFISDKKQTSTYSCRFTLSETFLCTLHLDR